jgi:NAD+ kinase
MSNAFTTVALIGRQRKEDISDTLLALKHLLEKRKINIVIEAETATYLPNIALPTYSRDVIAKYCDLIIVVGGDGSLLSAAHAATNNQVPVLGINRGRLGFLTDIHPSELDTKVNAVLDGTYQEEKRFLLTVRAQQDNELIMHDMALNDIVLMPGDAAQMIEFSITIDNQFVCNQRADGLIVATPTGSTAYALSGGGPILHPHLEAIALVPMFPHTLSARPIVINSHSSIKILIASSNEACPRLSCDGQTRIPLIPGTDIHIERKAEELRLIHPTDYNYFQTLRTKLHWHA